MSKKENSSPEEERREAGKKQSLSAKIGKGIRGATKTAMFTAACVGAGTLVGASNYFYKTALVPKRQKENPKAENEGKEYIEGRKWAAGHPGRKDIYIRADDGLQLHANLIPSEDPDCHRYAVCVHGYAGSSFGGGLFASVYRDRYGMNVLLPDLRGFGSSDGDYIGMGYDDSRDLLCWLDWIIQKDPDARIVLHGVSLGAATVLMTTGLSLPSQVRAAISDSSYTTALESLEYLYKKQNNAVIPAPVMMEFLRAVTLVRAGYDLAKASPVEAVAHSHTPTLFIQGQADHTIPAEMMPRLYKAASCPKAFLWIPGADHKKAVIVDPETYWARVERFLHAQGMEI